MSTENAGFVVILTENLRFAQAEQVNFIQNSTLKTEKIYAIL